MTNIEPRLAVLALAVAMVAELGCGPRTVTVGALDVAPKLASPRPQGRLALALAPATPDALQIRVPDFPLVEVRAFRTTLRRAFERAFAPAGTGAAGAVLRIEVTDVAFVSERKARAWRSDGALGATIVLAHGGAPHSPKAKPRRPRFAQLRFAASLRERGSLVARFTGLATATEATSGTADSVATSLGSAVAVLYQRIARELFQARTALAPREER